MKWFVAEHDSDRARLLRSRARNNNENLIVPSHMTAEVASAVYKRVQQGGLQTSEAVRIVGALEKVVIESVTSPASAPWSAAPASRGGSGAARAV